MTDDQYIHFGGVHCPVCHSTNIDADPPEVDMDKGDVFSQNQCLSCDSVWNDVYIISRIEMIRRGRQ